MISESEICTSILKCFYDFQTLVAGLLAGFAALISLIVVWRSATLPIRAQRRRDKELEDRRKNYVRHLLSEEFKLLATRARQAEGTIRVIIGAQAKVTDDTRSKTKLQIHPIIAEWESMSLLPTEIVTLIMSLRHKVEDHNFDMERAGGSFGADNFRDSIKARVKSIQGDAMRLSSKLLSTELVSK